MSGQPTADYYDILRRYLARPPARAIQPIRRPFVRVSHQPTLDLVGMEYERAADAVRRLDAFERAEHIVLPLVVRDWYETSAAEFLLDGADMNGAAAHAEWEIDSSRRRGLPVLVVLSNDADARWGVWLNGDADPPVLMQTSPGDAWGPSTDHFSEFAFARVWDEYGPRLGASITVRDRHFEMADVAGFRGEFPYTAHMRYGRTFARTFRFIGDESAIEIRIGDTGAAWILFAASDGALRRLMEWALPAEKRPDLHGLESYTDFREFPAHDFADEFDSRDPDADDDNETDDLPRDIF